jgi:hypothetical protein
MSPTQVHPRYKIRQISESTFSTNKLVYQADVFLLCSNPHILRGCVFSELGMHAEEEGATESRDGGDDGGAPLSEVVVRQTVDHRRVDHRRVDHRRVDRHVLVMGSPLGPDAAVAGRLEAPGDNVPVAAYGNDPDRLDLYSPHLYKARRNSNSP